MSAMAPAQSSTPLFARFEESWGVNGSGQVFDALKLRYQQPCRGYHNWKHIEECLAWSERYFAEHPAVGTRQIVQLALFFHDAVYEPGGRGNEDASAALLGEWASSAGMPPSHIQQAQLLVQATNDAVKPQDFASLLVRDFDRAVLGASSERYGEYAQGIRVEHNCADWLFTLGRARFVRGELRRKSIFQTEFFHERLEMQARANLEAELRGES